MPIDPIQLGSDFLFIFLDLRITFAMMAPRREDSTTDCVGCGSRTPSMQDAKNGASLGALNTASRGEIWVPPSSAAFLYSFFA